MVDLLNPNIRGSRGGVRIRYPGIYRSQFLDQVKVKSECNSHVSGWSGWSGSDLQGRRAEFQVGTLS